MTKINAINNRLFQVHVTLPSGVTRHFFGVRALEINESSTLFLTMDDFSIVAYAWNRWTKYTLEI